MPTVKRKRKKHIRNLARNQSGRKATVKVATYTGEKKGKKSKFKSKNKKHYAAPTITFKDNEPARPQSFDEALSKGEVYEFKRKRRAERFAAGSWKKGKAKREAMRDYRKFKKERRKKRKQK